jgi:hypothetical protein
VAARGDRGGANQDSDGDEELSHAGVIAPGRAAVRESGRSKMRQRAGMFVSIHPSGASAEIAVRLERTSNREPAK